MAGHITRETAKGMAPFVASACTFASEYLAKRRLEEQVKAAQTVQAPAKQVA